MDLFVGFDAPVNVSTKYGNLFYYDQHDIVKLNLLQMANLKQLTPITRAFLSLYKVNTKLKLKHLNVALHLKGLHVRLSNCEFFYP